MIVYDMISFRLIEYYIHTLTTAARRPVLRARHAQGRGDRHDGLLHLRLRHGEGRESRAHVGVPQGLLRAVEIAAALLRHRQGTGCTQTVNWLRVLQIGLNPYGIWSNLLLQRPSPYCT
jgi:hypothetical protein